jgi:hypothetical protein
VLRLPSQAVVDSRFVRTYSNGYKSPPWFASSGFSLLWTLGSRAVCSIANACIRATSRGGEPRECKNDNSTKDDYESAHNGAAEQA